MKNISKEQRETLIKKRHLGVTGLNNFNGRQERKGVDAGTCSLGYHPLGAWDGLRYFIVALPEPSI